MSPKQVDRHGERYPAPEELCCSESGWIDWPAPVTWRKSFFLHHLGYGKTGPAAQSSNSPPVWTGISTIRGKPSSAQRKDTDEWFDLSDHREEIRSKLENLSPRGTNTWVARKNNQKWGFSRKIADPVSCGTFPRAEGLILLLIVGTSDTYLQELSSKTIAKTARALPTERWMKGTTGLYRTVWIQWPGSSDPQQ